MKKHLLIFLIAISCNFLYSEISNFSEIYFRSITTKTYGLYPPESYNFNSGIIYKNNFTATKGNFTAVLNNEFFLSDASDENRNSLLFNQLFSDLSYNNDGNHLHLKNMFRNYDLSQTIKTYLPGYENSITKSYQNFLFFDLQKDFSVFDINGYFGLRSLHFKDNIDNQKYSDSDFYSNFNLNYSITKKIDFGITTLLKNDLNDSNQYDFSKIGFGISLKNPILKSGNFKLNYFKLKSDAIPKILSHNFVFSYHKRFNIFRNLNGFVHYISHNVYSKKDKKYYRLANMIRIQTKYRLFKKDYLISGLRLSIENENKIYFTEYNHNFKKNIKISARLQKSINFYDEYIVSAKYYFNNINSIWIENDFTDYLHKMKQNEIFVGFTTYLTK
jgi:hypothetical protein